MLIAAAAHRAPWLAYRLLDLTAALTPGPRERQLPAAAFRALLPHLAEDELAAARRRAWRNRLRNAVFKRAQERYGIAAARRISGPDAGLGALEPPAILMSFHLGPLLALGPQVERLPVPIFMLAGEVPGTAYANVVSVPMRRTDPSGLARAFAAALAVLRERGVVFVAPDGPHGTPFEVPFLGTHLSLARGGFSLARLSGAPIVPVAVRWDGARVVYERGDPVPARPDEQELASEVVAWLEAYLRERPGELTRHLIERADLR